MISQKFAKTNNPYLEDYDPEQPNIYIMYLDANNLYAWAMSQCLPTSKFAWVHRKELEQLDVMASSNHCSTAALYVHTFFTATVSAQRLSFLTSQHLIHDNCFLVGVIDGIFVCILKSVVDSGVVCMLSSVVACGLVGVIDSVLVCFLAAW